MTNTVYTLDDLGGRLTVGSLAHFVRHLPPSSATKRALFPEDEDKLAWADGRVTAELVARLISEVRGIEYMYHKRNFKGHAKFEPFPTPWDEPAEESVQRIGSDPIPIADFDDWFDNYRDRH